MTRRGKFTHHPTRNSDKASPVTGKNATMDEAELGSEGNGAALFGGDFTGGFPDPLEQEPDEASDIRPDHIFIGNQREAQIWDEEEDEVTAQATEKADFEGPDFEDEEYDEAFNPLDNIEQ